MTSTFRAYVVRSSESGLMRSNLEELTEDQLPAGEVTIDVHYSSVNYKDALASQAHPGVIRKLPHVPGIDAAGAVRSSSDPRFQPGDEVIVTGYELGAHEWGGWSQRIRVPAESIVPKPQGLSLFEAMVLGTAGFTAAQSALAIQRCEIKPEAGEVLVTGASGGVGSLSVKLLSQLGYSVVASTGKLDQAGLLVAWGAKRVIDREDLATTSNKPLLSARWAAAVDTVGGTTLANVLRETSPYGCVAACGLVGGADLSLTLMPFLIRGVTLAGIASAMYPADRRAEIWRLLSGPWKIENLKELATTVPLSGVRDVVAQILQGQVLGRTVVDLRA